jgi:hypothetical protein
MDGMKSLPSNVHANDSIWHVPCFVKFPPAQGDQGQSAAIHSLPAKIWSTRVAVGQGAGGVAQQ